MEGKKLVVVMLAAAITLAVLTFGLYLATRQIENEDNGESGSPAAVVQPAVIPPAPDPVWS